MSHLLRLCPPDVARSLADELNAFGEDLYFVDYRYGADEIKFYVDRQRHRYSRYFGISVYEDDPHDLGYVKIDKNQSVLSGVPLVRDALILRKQWIRTFKDTLEKLGACISPPADESFYKNGPRWLQNWYENIAHRHVPYLFWHWPQYGLANKNNEWPIATALFDCGLTLACFLCHESTIWLLINAHLNKQIQTIYFYERPSDQKGAPYAYVAIPYDQDPELVAVMLASSFLVLRGCNQFLWPMEFSFDWHKQLEAI